MKKLLFVLAGLSSCFPAVNERKMSVLIDDLENIHKWDPIRGAHQSESYYQLLQMGEDALEPLAKAVLDERPTMIQDSPRSMPPLVGDVAFLIALKIKGQTIEDYADLGVRRIAHPNPLFALEFEEGARARARDRILGKKQ